MMPSCTLSQYRDENNNLTGTAIELPPIVMDFLVQNPFVSERPLRIQFPLPDSAVASTRHAFNTTYPGANYQCLVQATGGSPPYKYELLSGPGSIGEFLTEDVSGDLEPDANYGVITAPSISGGAFNYVVRVVDQDGNFDIAQWIVRSELALNFFAATANVGTGSGADEANARSLATTYLGATTDSPAKGKVLRLLAGDYPADRSLQLSAQYNPVSIAAITGANVILHDKILPFGDDLYVEGVTLQGVDPGADGFGIISFSGLTHRHTIWRCMFDGITNLLGGSNNQACIGANLLSAGAEARENITIVDCEFKNSPDVHNFDFYSIESFVYERCINTIDDPSITAVTRSTIFPKSTCYNYQIAYNRVDYIGIPALSAGIVQIYNAMESNARQTYRGDVFYNTFRCDPDDVEEYVFSSNRAANSKVSSAGAITITNRVCRNSISGPMESNNFDRAWNVERQSFYENNAVQSPSGGIPTPGSPTNSPVWFSKTGTECDATSGVFDSNMKLTGSAAAYAGTRGAQLRRLVV